MSKFKLKTLLKNGCSLGISLKTLSIKYQSKDLIGQECRFEYAVRAICRLVCFLERVDHTYLRRDHSSEKYKSQITTQVPSASNTAIDTIRGSIHACPYHYMY